MKLLRKEIALDTENNDLIITVGGLITAAACLFGLGVCVALILFK